jgi:CRISPR-associated endonuclease/helicase Cas3
MIKPKLPTMCEPLPAVPWSECLAKTYIAQNGDKLAGRTVFNHCQIVGLVARELLNRMPSDLRLRLFPKGAELAAAAHDIGKVSPTFQEKIFRGTKDYQRNSRQELKDIVPELESGWGGHAGVSQAEAAMENLGKYIPEILGQHHGYAPPLGAKNARSEQFGGLTWQAERLGLMRALQDNLTCDWPIIENKEQARVIAGLTSVADWIGSGPFFENPADNWEPNISAAVDHAGFIAPVFKPDLSFTDIFSFEPKATQTQLFSVANQPGVYILEAPMGLGKTEAALYAAYQTITAGLATGIYFALPTQLTSDKIHQRVNQFLEKILVEEKRALLLHSNAWLKEMGEEGQPGGSWFSQGKRGILAPFAVGTIDQALMAVMNVKHGFVRAFGLAGKVVILDEVHSYDSYTGTILDELVKTLRALHCTVIILSATLTQERRQALLGQAPTQSAYPLISAMENTSLTEITVDPLLDTRVSLSMLSDQGKAINEALLRAQNGQQVLWIENTVGEAQDIYRTIGARAHDLGIAYGLLHSRFLKIDRERNEQKWVTLFGKDGASERGKQGRILIGTQVLEQSLDIDADYLVSRFCPTDMLLQRLGRLWRHTNTVRPTSARCEAWLLAPPLKQAIDQPEQAFGNTAYVYNPYVLCRSLEVWGNYKEIALPSMIRSLIEDTYKPRSEQGKMAQWEYELEHGHRRGRGIQGRQALRTLGLQALSSGMQTLSDSKAATRYGEQDSTSCLLLRAVCHETDKTVLTLLGGECLILPKNHKTLPKQEWRKIAANIMQNTVTVAAHHAPEALPVKQLAWLENYAYVNNKYDFDENKKAKLPIAIVQESGELRSLNGASAAEKYRLEYCSLIGYQTSAIKLKS